MKNTMRRTVSVLLAALMAVTMFSFTSANFTVGAADYNYSGSVAYVSDNGNDSNDGKTAATPKLTFAAAKAVAGSGGTVVVTDTLTVMSNTKIGEVTIAGLNSESKFVLKQWCVALDGALTFKNIILQPSVNYSFLLAQGHKLVIDENVSTVKGEGVTSNLGIRGGGDVNNINGNTNVVVKSGTFGGIYAGTRGGNVAGNCYVEVHGGVTVATVGAGNDGNAEINDGKTISGASVIKLVGAPTITNVNSSDLVKGGLYLDISEFTGTVSEKWTLAKNGKVVTDSKDLPDMNAVVSGDGSGTVEVPEIPTIPTEGNVTDLSGETKIVYLSDYGDDSKDGKTVENAVKTLAKALSIGGADVTVVIVDKYSHKTNTKIANCKIIGLKDTSVFETGIWCITMTGDLTMENLTFNVAYNWSFFLAQGNKLVIGENVTTTRNQSITSDMCIRGGGENTSVNGDTNVVLKSGTYTAVYGATKNGAVSGNQYVEVHEGAVINNLYLGNNGGEETSTTGGTAYLKLVGTPDIKNVQTTKSGYPEKGHVIDAVEYVGELPSNWAILSAQDLTIYKTEADFSEEYRNYMVKSKGEYDLSGEKNLVYISDAGNDQNDGKTPETAFATLEKAYEVLGEKGGTVAVTGTYTYNKAATPKGPVKLTSTCKDDTFIWNVWVLFAKGIEINNLKIVVEYNYAFLLHGGMPVVIGDNVEMKISGKAKVYPGIRAGENGDINGNTDIVISGGSWNTVYTGTKNGNVNGSANIVVDGGEVKLISFGNDSTTGQLMGNATVTLVGSATIGGISTKNQTAGICILDTSKFGGSIALPENTEINIIKDENGLGFIPVSRFAQFINGYTDGTFKPDKSMTRAEAITVVAKICGVNTFAEMTSASAFTDVKPTDWYYQNVKWLEEREMLGFWGTELKAGEGITRGEFVKLIDRLYTAPAGTASFSDVPPAHAYAKEISNAATAGLVNGYTDGTFKPDKTLTRAEIVTILNRLIRRNPVAANIASVSMFSDIDSHWAKNNIVAAAIEREKDGAIMWYTGGKMNELTAEQLAALDTKLTTATMNGVDAANADAVKAAIQAKTEARIAEIRAAKTDVKVTGTSYYVSADGNDSNDGKTPETAWKTTSKVSAANLAAGDGVFFRRGDVFRGQIITKAGVTYSAYGEGEKPHIYGSLKNYSGIGFWQKTDKENVWVSSETFSADVGLMVFNHGEAWSIKKINGLGGYKTGELKADLEYEHNTADQKLYLYSVSDPNTRWISTEIAPGDKIIGGDGNNVTIDNLCLKYTGAHCIGYSDGTNGLTVQNCEMGWIGGKIQYWDDTRVAVRYGNAVEIYIGCKDYTIDNCYIYQVYDAGITHQYFQTRDAYVNMENIRYTDNVITHCTYAIEYCNAQPVDKGIMQDIVISGNILSHSGDGWGNQRPDRGDAVIKGWSLVNNSREFYVYDNIVMTEDANTMLLHMGVKEYAFLPVVARNLFLGKDGNKFGYYGINVPTLITYGENVKSHMGLGENTFVVSK